MQPTILAPHGRESEPVQETVPNSQKHLSTKCACRKSGRVPSPRVGTGAKCRRARHDEQPKILTICRLDQTRERDSRSAFAWCELRPTVLGPVDLNSASAPQLGDGGVRGHVEAASTVVIVWEILTITLCACPPSAASWRTDATLDTSARPSAFDNRLTDGLRVTSEPTWLSCHLRCTLRYSTTCASSAILGAQWTATRRQSLPFPAIMR